MNEDHPSYSVAKASDYVILLKPRVMSLVLLTGLVGLIVAPGSMHPVMAFTALLCIAVGAGASGALNMWYDRDIDAIMQRTRLRPIPSGTIAPENALAYGIFLSVASVTVMGLMINLMSAALLALTIVYYVVIYTMWLKRRTPQNIVIGGAAGAFPPMIGWAAVTGTVTLEPIVLFMIIFMWTPPHFWALALYRSGDYGKAGVPMLPVVSGQAETRWQILVYTVLMVPFTVLPGLMGFAGWLYSGVAAVTGLMFLYMAFDIWWVGRRASDDTRPTVEVVIRARRLFRFSILYLFLLFILLAAERLIGIPTLAPVINL